MIGMRTAAGLLTAALVTAAVGCARPAEPAAPTATTPATAAAAPANAAAHASESLEPLVQQALPNVPGKTFTSAIVAFPPGARAASHRHGDAFLYVYVLEGAVRSQVDGEPVRTFHQGENWTEQPGAHHVVAENASPTAPAKLLVVFVSTTGAELKVDDPNG